MEKKLPEPYHCLLERFSEKLKSANCGISEEIQSLGLHHIKMDIQNLLRGSSNEKYDTDARQRMQIALSGRCSILDDFISNDSPPTRTSYCNLLYKFNSRPEVRKKRRKKKANIQCTSEACESFDKCPKSNTSLKDQKRESVVWNDRPVNIIPCLNVRKTKILADFKTSILPMICPF